MIDYGFSDAHSGLIHLYFVGLIGVVAVLAIASGAPLLPGHDARRAGRRRPARRRLRPPDPPRPQFLRRREDRRAGLAPDGRHHPAQGDLRLVGVDRAAQLLHVHRRGGDDGRHLAETLGLRAGGDPDHRPAALRRRTDGDGALAPRPGPARRRDRLRRREPLGGTRHAGLRRRGFRRPALPRRRRGGLRRGAGDDAVARRSSPSPRCSSPSPASSVGAVARRQRRRRRPHDRRRAVAVPALRRARRRRARPIVGSVERGFAGRRRGGAHRRAHRRRAAHRRAERSGAPALAGARRDRLRPRRLRLSRPTAGAGAART